MKKRKNVILLVVGVFFLLVAAPFSRAAAEEAGVEQKLREALRDGMLKLRDAQGKIAALQAEQVASEEKIKELKSKSDALAKDLMAERNASANRIADLSAKLEEKTNFANSLQIKMERWKKSYQEAVTLAAKKETERAKLELKSLELTRLVESHELKNIQMYQAGMETLERYQKFGLGDALLAREPFIGTTKVKFQNLTEEFADKLADAKIKKGAPKEGEKPAQQEAEKTPEKATEKASEKEAAETKKEPKK